MLDAGFEMLDMRHKTKVSSIKKQNKTKRKDTKAQLSINLSVPPGLTALEFTFGLLLVDQSTNCIKKNGLFS